MYSLCFSSAPRICVLGIGGCGCNTINQLRQANLPNNVRLISVNTETQQRVADSNVEILTIGPNITHGLGAGARPEIGRQAALESEPELKELICNVDILFLTAGMGGGTGTGASPEVARMARELGKPVMAIATLPFAFERRDKVAKAGIQALEKYANAIICLPNEQLSKVLGNKISLLNAFEASNKILQDVLMALANTINQAGLINIDLNDFIAIIGHKGKASMGVGKLQAGDDLEDLLIRTLHNPLLEAVDLSFASGVIVSVVAKETLELSQYQLIGDTVQQQLKDSAQVVVGLTINPELSNELEVMIIATGIEEPEMDALPPLPSLPAAEDYINVLDFVQQPKSVKSRGDDYDVPTIHRRKLP